MISVSVGLGALQYLPFALGCIHLLTPKWIAAGLILIAILVWREWLVIFRAAPRVIVAIGQWFKRQPLWIKILLVILFVALAECLTKTIMPPTDNDGITYHLTAPKRWLQAGALVYLRSYVHTNSPMGLEMIYLISLALWSDTVTKLFHFTFGLITIGATVLLARRLGNERAGWLAASISIIGYFLGLMEMAFIDMAVVGYFMLTLYAYLRWAEDPNQPESNAWLILAAIFAGFTTTSKLTGLFVIIGLCLAVFWRLLVLKGDAKTQKPLKTTLLAGSIALLIVAPWFLRALVLVGNPFYPFLYRFFGGRDMTAAASAIFQTDDRYWIWGNGHITADWSLKAREMLYWLGIVAALVLCGFIFIKQRSTELKGVCLIASTFLILQMYGSGLYERYIFSLLPLVLVGIMLVALRYIEKWPHSSALMSLIVVIILIPKLPRPNAISYALRLDMGEASRNHYLERKIPVYSVYEAANRILPKGSYILLDGGGAPYYSHYPCFISNALWQQAIRYNNWDHFVAEVKKYRINALIFNWDDLKIPDIRSGLARDGRTNEYPYLLRLAKQYGRPLASHDGIVLYSLVNLYRTNPKNTAVLPHQ